MLGEEFVEPGEDEGEHEVEEDHCVPEVALEYWDQDKTCRKGMKMSVLSLSVMIFVWYIKGVTRVEDGGEDLHTRIFSQGSRRDNPKVVSSHIRFLHKKAPRLFFGGW